MKVAFDLREDRKWGIGVMGCLNYQRRLFDVESGWTERYYFDKGLNKFPEGLMESVVPALYVLLPEIRASVS